MKTRMQFCPVCRAQTPHRYQGVSIIAFVFFFLFGVFPAFIYLWIAFRRADRTATCTVDHHALELARERESTAAMMETMLRVKGEGAEVPAQRQRGSGFMTRY
ncbi:hypothetical protein M3A49_26720 [Paraburkholderia sp. CNPSo 3076]|uniref:hypothetical protein n=1 Tax=Paraburkholderia sp. CNPSo 3076 TaxID=2940936 RepID=UPI0022568EB1|nr:hypothetical protein [Paraburkholderia sp. CNPSo 3076]MCX5543039.1 hypothetical protein [Paraburkholderia sp. CNPSo 3076]